MQIHAMKTTLAGYIMAHTHASRFSHTHKYRSVRLCGIEAFKNICRLEPKTVQISNCIILLHRRILAIHNSKRARGRIVRSKASRSRPERFTRRQDSSVRGGSLNVLRSPAAFCRMSGTFILPAHPRSRIRSLLFQDALQVLFRRR